LLARKKTVCCAKVSGGGEGKGETHPKGTCKQNAAFNEEMVPCVQAENKKNGKRRGKKPEEKEERGKWCGKTQTGS